MTDPNRPRAGAAGRAFESAFKFARWLFVVLFAVYMLSGIRQIELDEVGLTLRFGRLTGATRAQQIKQPGLLWTLPYPFDEVIRVPVRQVKELDIRDLWRGPGPDDRDPRADDDPDAISQAFRFADDEAIDPTREGYCITGDFNVVQPRIVVKYRIADPVDYALHTLDPESMIRDAVIDSMNRTMARMRVDYVLTEGKPELSRLALTRAQGKLDQVAVGVELLSLELTELIPPRHVLDAFQAVISSSVDAETRVLEAETYRARRLPQARSDKQSLIRQAESDKADIVARAQGRTSAFLSLLEEYDKNPEIVGRRIYLEKLETVFRRAGQKLLLDPEAVNDPDREILIQIPSK